MKPSLKTAIALSIIPQIILVKILGSQTQFIETFYSRGLYPYISRLFRLLFGWVPFSVGDIVYLCLAVLALSYLFKNWRIIRSHKLKFFRNVLMVLSVAYFTFHIMWGFNYYREPLAMKLNLKEVNDFNELVALTERLIQKTNETQRLITLDTAAPVSIPYRKKTMFSKTVEGYDKLSKKYPFFTYQTPSIKTSLISTILTYMGYAGYLNPFTGEAQVNSRLPNFRFPVVTGHEIGHQLGYSAENETNFIGYLVTANNEDAYFKYSAYAYALGYCLNDIHGRDQELFQELYAKLNHGVVLNFKEMNDFWQAFENPMEPVFKSIFNNFLKANNQPKGIQSYNEMVFLLIAYHRQNPL